VVLVAGIVPGEQQNMLAVFPPRSRMAFRALDALSKLSRQDFKLPRPAITSYLCNGIDPMEVVHVVGLFGPMPSRVMKTRMSLAESNSRCPVTYVVLTRDRLLPLAVQQRMAQRVPDVETIELDSCHQVMLYRPRELADILLRYA
jgi:pimeloyl-ACP methyl ester carboxylesterase